MKTTKLKNDATRNGAYAVYTVLQRAAPSVMGHCIQYTCMTSSGASIGVRAKLLQLARNGLYIASHL